MSEETSILCSVANVFDQKFGNNYVSNTFRTIGYILPDLAIEKQLGLTEQTKCKWKIVVELCATFDYLYVKFFGEELRFRLLDLHGQVQELRNINKEYDLDEAYQVYCQIYKHPCDRERFNDTTTRNPMRYIVIYQNYLYSFHSIDRSAKYSIYLVGFVLLSEFQHS